ncbi:hypothetical protein SAM23877_7604 [Streptomyces ambofaciens ATCC 23877]|uniref:Uncharacterized protein n=1 Tax=Streptomyces ambofaciens (strain ATCC 23877 / 3486 / DSM 40053 / JCM 4204 / NBRC 12836 / NRRL B-2516) TaxID=278992 RepID=A0A0K2AJU5_STRA7|nr:hypothetical protein SAM23877_0068 [Streptomyces ambofaciens ATCC 23877]AKZ60645.1 hypothetical protein SAM23877_7604 [Streptomyces ambofaciens ATCC 23877]
MPRPVAFICTVHARYATEQGCHPDVLGLHGSDGTHGAGQAPRARLAGRRRPVGFTCPHPCGG